MQITGNDHMTADRATAWEAFHDPGVLTRTIPGLQSLTEDGPDRYKVVVTAGVAAIKGTYKGTVEFIEQHPQDYFVLRASGAGGPGTIEADIAVTVTESPEGGIDLEWKADAAVGGAVGGVGQRMLTGVARKMATGFFADIDNDIAGGGAVMIEEAEAAEGGATDDAATAGPRTWEAPATSSGAPARGVTDVLIGTAVGGILVLTGVLVGAKVARR